jgi:hypothetical protein
MADDDECPLSRHGGQVRDDGRIDGRAHSAFAVEHVQSVADVNRDVTVHRLGGTVDGGRAPVIQAELPRLFAADQLPFRSVRSRPAVAAGEDHVAHADIASGRGPPSRFLLGRVARRIAIVVGHAHVERAIRQPHHGTHSAHRRDRRFIGRIVD